jgi:hypothetical protein
VNWVRVGKDRFTKIVKQNLLSGRLFMIMSEVSDGIIGQKCGFKSGVLGAERDVSLQRDKENLHDVIFSKRYSQDSSRLGYGTLSISTDLTKTLTILQYVLLSVCIFLF